MDSEYREIPIELIKLDNDNPRIASVLEMYGDNITSEAISLALGSSGSDCDSSTSFDTLKESIKVNGGIIHPIIVNEKEDHTLVVIEGNTRVQIYKELKASGVAGNWDTIRSIVYHNMSEEAIHSIRLQSHLVGPRSWKPYAKAKYVSELYNKQKLSINDIISYCGGNKKDILSLIKAYEDMEKYYRPSLPEGYDFDERKFSYFIELNSAKVLKALSSNGYTKQDYAKWVIEERLTRSDIHPRKLNQILANKSARKEFLKTNAEEAMKLLHIDEGGHDLKGASILSLSDELIIKLNDIKLNQISEDRDDYSIVESLEYLSDVIDRTLSNIRKLREEHD